MKISVFAKKIYTRSKRLENQTILADNGKITGIQP